VRTLAVKLTSFEQDRSFDKPTDSLNAYEKVLRGRQLLSDTEFSANLDARELFKEAIDLDQAYADAHVGLGLTHIADYTGAGSKTLLMLLTHRNATPSGRLT